jgi:hypothetical protein
MIELRGTAKVVIRWPLTSEQHTNVFKRSLALFPDMVLDNHAINQYVVSVGASFRNGFVYVVVVVPRHMDDKELQAEVCKLRDQLYAELHAVEDIESRRPGESVCIEWIDTSTKSDVSTTI